MDCRYLLMPIVLALISWPPPVAFALGRCRPPCACVNIKCKPALQADARMSLEDCEMEIAAADCAALGIQEGRNCNGGIPSPNPDRLDIDKAKAYCLVMHEFAHAALDTCKSLCNDEVVAYGKTEKCFYDLGETVCKKDPNSALCKELRYQECANGAAAMGSDCQATLNAKCKCDGCEDMCNELLELCKSRYGLTTDKNMCRRWMCLYCPSPAGCE